MSDEIEKLILPKSLYEEIERRAVNVYKECDGHFPIDVFSIIKKRGYKLKLISNILKTNILSQDYDGLSCFNPFEKNYIIVVDDSQVIQRIRYTVSHELGHIEFGHKEESELANVIANYFAGYLLAPSPLIYLKKCTTAEDVANTFDISFACAKICFDRYNNWLNYGGKYYKDYEKELLKLFKGE